MRPIEEQLDIIKSLIGENHKIKVKEDGFVSRGFVVDNGKLVFKFPRRADVSYETEIDNLNYINSLKLGVNLQKVAYSSQSNEYLGIYGVIGNSLEEINLSEEEQRVVGKQLGLFLKKLHQIKEHNGMPCTLKAEIEAWQNRVKFVNDFITKTFSEREQEIITALMFEYMPNKLNGLGENLVFSHGDLGDGNVFVDDKLKVGVIDFNESGLLDEAGDFMDISSDIIREEMLNAYGATQDLREKVEIRRDIRPLIVLKPYLTRNNPQVINELVGNIRQTLTKYEHFLDKENVKR
ncbi:MAG: aminoglycoside phosphotransferase family protein [Clostridiales bacterium]|nr:aminoglycoside phosphotransferase family protein [Clostridiales bacterium]